MKVTTNTEDGSLGFQPSAAPNYIVAPAAAGPTDTVMSFGTPAGLYDLYEAGKAPDTGAFLFGQGIGPLSILRLGASTAGSAAVPTKVPISGDTEDKVFFGGKMLAGADANGNVLFVARQTGVTLTVVSGMSAGYAVSTKAITLTVANDTTGTQLAALALGAAAGLIEQPVAQGTGASVCGQTLSTFTFDNGALTLTPLQQYVRVKAVISGSTSASLAVAEAAGEDAAGNVTADITITLGTTSGGQFDPTKNTGTLVAAALAGVSAYLDVAEVGSGAGFFAPHTSFYELQFGSSGAIAVNTSAPNNDYNLRVLITKDGTLGAGEFQVATDDAPDPGYGPITLIPGGGSYTVPGTGIELVFSGTFEAGDTFTSAVTGPTSTNTNIVAALAVLSNLNVDGGEVLICGKLTGAIGATVIAWIGTERAAGRDWVVYMHTRDYSSSSESEATYISSVKSDWGSNEEPVGCASIIPGWWDTVIPAKGIERCSFAVAALGQIWRLPYWVMPSSKSDGGGALRGLYTPLSPVAPRTHDERLNPGLGGSGGRFLTMQSLPGADNAGRFFVGDASGLRDCGTLAAGTSDWSLLPYARIGNRCRRAMMAFAPEVLARREGTKTDGTLLESVAQDLDQLAEAFIGRALKGAVQGVRVVFSRTEPVKSSKKNPYNVYLDVFGFALWVDGTVGLAPAK